MHDPTRPVTRWAQDKTVAEFTRRELDQFLMGYRRNLLQSQPHYVELVVEKLAALDIAQRAVGQYQVPVGVGRGYSSVTSLDDTAERFRASGKPSMPLLIAGDFDAEGEDIARVWGSCLRDEHGMRDLTVVKLAVNPEQVDEYDLDPVPLKDTSSRAPRFRQLHGDQVYEMEAFEPQVLQSIMQQGVRSVLDMELFVAEQQREAEDARYLMACRRQVQETFKDIDFGDLGG
jgi:hypothetical protein